MSGDMRVWIDDVEMCTVGGICELAPGHEGLHIYRAGMVAAVPAAVGGGTARFVRPRHAENPGQTHDVGGVVLT